MKQIFSLLNNHFYMLSPLAEKTFFLHYIFLLYALLIVIIVLSDLNQDVF